MIELVVNASPAELWVSLVLTALTLALAAGIGIAAFRFFWGSHLLSGEASYTQCVGGLLATMCKSEKPTAMVVPTPVGHVFVFVAQVRGDKKEELKRMVADLDSKGGSTEWIEEQSK